MIRIMPACLAPLAAATDPILRAAIAAHRP